MINIDALPSASSGGGGDAPSNMADLSSVAIDNAATLKPRARLEEDEFPPLNGDVNLKLPGGILKSSRVMKPKGKTTLRWDVFTEKMMHDVDISVLV